MINSDELLFVVDENNKPLRPLSRQIVHTQGIWHRTSHVWVINKKRQLLCQKRSAKMDRYPGFWEPRFGGHMAPGVDYLKGVVKEIMEELGIKVNPQELSLFKIYKSQDAKEFQGIYILQLLDGRKINREEDEIDELKWINLEKVVKISKERRKGWVRSGYEDEMLNYLEENFRY